MFRIYAGKDNKPAKYSVNNVLYVPKKSLSISLDGTTEGDFTMVFGFPGKTMEYLLFSVVEQTIEVNDPIKISIRDKALSVIDERLIDKDSGTLYSVSFFSCSHRKDKGKNCVTRFLKSLNP